MMTATGTANHIKERAGARVSNASEVHQSTTLFQTGNAFELQSATARLKNPIEL